MHNKILCTFTFATLFLLIACGTSKPYIIEMPPQFESSARSINVKKPNLIFKDKHFDVALGDYQVINSRIGQFEREKNKFSIAVDEYKDTWVDLLRDKKIFPQTTSYESFGQASSRDYSFEIATNNEKRITSKCSLITSHIVVEETTKDILGLTTKKKSPPSYDDGKWIQTNFTCDVNTSKANAKLSVLEIKDKKPIYVFDSSTQEYQFAPMYNLISPRYIRLEDQPTISNQNSGIQDAPLAWRNIHASTRGITVFRDNKPVAVITLILDNYVIWLANSLDTDESELLLGIGHSLILSNWMDNR